MDDQADIEMSQSDVTSQEIVTPWLEKFRLNEMTTADFDEHWSQWVPKIYTPGLEKNCLSWNFDEDLAQRVLFHALEEFICNGEPISSLGLLKHAVQNSSVCGRFFKLGEPTYSCRECGMDKTCVLCVECFKHSQHRFHKYRMGTSGGGGCCDCGDVEAWKKDPYCTIHAPKTASNNDTEEETLPEDMRARTRILFDAVLSYADDLLNTDKFVDDGLSSRGSNSSFGVDAYCTILYNDEVHTFEQVISTLARVLKCDQKSCTEYVTNIDREGRATVKCSSFSNCMTLKEDIEKYTSRHGNKPLKVSVCHAHVIAHQIYAMKLLTWLEKLLGQGKGFRAIFAECALKPRPGQAYKPAKDCVIKEIMRRDSSLWKSARTQWHRLLIAGMLMEYANKMALAKIFTKNYGQIMKDFIKDDHDHSYSISSLSVQLFTVPTLAHHLIANDEILYNLLNALISECSKKLNKDRKLEFERNPAFHTFKRTLYMLYDLKYLLGAIPESWTDDLRRNFLHGLSILFNLLTMMQGMDSVTRQVGQHMEYEPEWESGFNLHIRLSSCISLAAEWCGTDRIVLVKAYRMALKKLEENPCYEPTEAGEVRELADHGTACLHYDVAAKPVSIHLPLTRFLAALHLHLEKMQLHFDGPEFQVVKPTPVQIIEPVLRAQVMIAQVHAGMWRRNGYALLNTLFFYHNVKCRAEMLDRDITVLQVGASLIESNEFLIHVLNKFNLINWALPDFEINTLKSPEEDSMRQTVNLVEEFLHLLIVIIGERYMPGVSTVTLNDRIRKEMIQSLCIKPSPHSELVKTLSDDLESHEVAVDDVIKDIAVFKKPPHGTGKGVYELKEPFYEEFNVFYYHFTREELSKAEESQRKRRKTAGELECCPPPKLPKLTESFTLLVNLLQCDVMLHVMQTVFERCLNLRARSFSESQLHKVLHLVGYALQEEESGNYVFFKFIENATKFKLFALMEELLKCPRVDAHKGLLLWTLEKYKKLSRQDEVPEPVAVDQQASTSAEKVDTEKERRAKLAAEKRAKVMAQMQAMQKNFIKENANLFETTNMETSSISEDANAMEITEAEPIALGPRQSARVTMDKTYTCILCQEEERVTPDGPAMVLAAFVQQATVLCQYKNDPVMDIANHDYLYLHANLGPAPHTSTCGHVMHSQCYTKYFDSVTVREHRRPYRLRHPSSFDVDKQEFLCPLCECLSNTVLSIIPPLSKLQPVTKKSDINFEDFLQGIDTLLRKKVMVCHGICDMKECENAHCTACVNASSGTMTEQDCECEVGCILQHHQVFATCDLDADTSQEIERNFAELFPKNQAQLNENFRRMITEFAHLTYTRGLNTGPNTTDKRIVPMAWKSLAYTVHSVEVLLREANKPLLGSLSSRQRDCLENLTRLVGVLGTAQTKSVVLNSHALTLLGYLFQHHHFGPSILQWDSFGLLVSLTYSLPGLLRRNSPTPPPTGGLLEWHVLRVIFTCHVVRILVLINLEDVYGNSESPSEETNKDSEEIVEILSLLGKYKDGVNGNAVWNYVRETSRPFLRCCVLLYYYLTDVLAPTALLDIGGDTFENMCAYLDLPTAPSELFDSLYIRQLVRTWCAHEEIQMYLQGTVVHKILEPVPVPRLIELPEDYSDLINDVSTFTCPNSDEDSRNPTMCLVCGEKLCSQSYCCQMELDKMQVGASNYHAAKCGGGVGVFLRVRECEVLLLASPHRGCFIVAPYLDDYGETDQGLRRGNPLRLCHERYEKLQRLWLGHSIHEEIARQIETSTHIVATQWNLL